MRTGVAIRIFCDAAHPAALRTSEETDSHVGHSPPRNDIVGENAAKNFSTVSTGSAVQIPERILFIDIFMFLFLFMVTVIVGIKFLQMHRWCMHMRQSLLLCMIPVCFRPRMDGGVSSNDCLPRPASKAGSRSTHKMKTFPHLKIVQYAQNAELNIVNTYN